MAPIDRLYHLNGNQRVKTSFQIAVVLAEHRDEVSETGLFHALFGEVSLVLRDRGGGDLRPVVLGGVQREASPTSADL